jgi:hypothetical protein
MGSVKTDYQRVKLNGDWNSYESYLGDHHFRIGDTVQVKWPDNTTSVHAVKMREVRGTYQDMGHEYGCVSHYAFITIEYRGVPLHLDLHDPSISVQLLAP